MEDTMSDTTFTLLQRGPALGQKKWLMEDEFEIDFSNPREFVLHRWTAAVDLYKIESSDLALADNVIDARTWEEAMRKTMADAKASANAMLLITLQSMFQLYRVLWRFEGLLKEVEPDVEDVSENVDVSSIWSMTFLNIKLSLDSIDKIRKTASWMGEFRRQLQLLLSSLQQSGDDGKSMRIEMSEIFDPALGILFEGISYLKRYHSEDDFVQNWPKRMELRVKDYLDAMEATVKHIRAMGTTRQINRLQETRIGNRRAEVEIRDREYPTDGSEKAIFPVAQLPTHRTPWFTGRTIQIEAIHDHLGIKEKIRLRTFLIYGRRGIGKTQIALEYANRYAEDYDAVFWIQCETAASLRQSFADAATTLELDGADKNGHFEENLMKVLRWLKQTRKRWLLIYDNAEREQLLKGFWPVGSTGAILLTSRTFYNFFEDDQRKGETVPVFSEGESRIALLKQLGTEWQEKHFNEEKMMYKVERAAADTLLQQTGGLPIAIAHAARLISNPKISIRRQDDSQGDVTIQGFLQLFNESHAKLPQRQTGKRDPLIHSLDTIWSIAFDALSENARAILSVLALVAPDEILIDLFLPSNQERLTRKLAFCRTDPGEVGGRATIQTVIRLSASFQAAIDELVAQSMVYKTGRNMTIHREVQEAVNYQNQDDLRESFDAAVNLLFDAFPQQKQGRPLTDDWLSCRRWIQHLVSLANKFKIYTVGRQEGNLPLNNMASNDLFVKLLGSCAWYLYEIADYDECLNIIAIACVACKDEPTLDYAHLLNTQGAVCFDQNRLRPARVAYDTSLRIREEKLGRNNPNDPELAITVSNLGNVESAQGNYKESLELLERSAGIRENIGDEAAVLLALNYLQIGRVYFLEENYPQAYVLYQRCEGVFMKKAGRTSWFLADLYYAYGNLEFAQREWQQAAKSYERARRVCMDHNPLHPLTAAVYYKLACAEFEQDHHTKALGYLEKAMNIAEVRNPGPIDGTLARILFKRAEIILDDPLQGVKRREEAKDSMDEMNLRQREISEELEVDLTIFDEDVDREKSFDALVAGFYR